MRHGKQLHVAHVELFTAGSSERASSGVQPCTVLNAINSTRRPAVAAGKAVVTRSRATEAVLQRTAEVALFEHGKTVDQHAGASQHRRYDRSEFLSIKMLDRILFLSNPVSPPVMQRFGGTSSTCLEVVYHRRDQYFMHAIVSTTSPADTKYRMMDLSANELLRWAH